MIILYLSQRDVTVLTKIYKESGRNIKKAQEYGKTWVAEDPEINTFTTITWPLWKGYGFIFEKKRCINCHFLAIRLMKTGHEKELVIPELRRSISEKDINWINRADNESICCYHGIWDEDKLLASEHIDVLYEMLDVNRKDKCYYRKYDTSMCFESAKKLEEREYELGKSRIDRRYTRYAIIIAIGALIINILTLLLKPTT